MNQATLIKADNGNARVSGELSFATVSTLRPLGIKLLATHSYLQFDFEKVTRSDSSALTLLTAWTRYAKENGKKIEFINLPIQLLEMAQLSRLDKILPIEKNS